MNRSDNVSVTPRLSWNSLCSMFSDQWVEIVASKWDDDSEIPRWVQVRNSANTRAELLNLMKNGNDSEESLILHVAGSKSVVETTAFPKQAYAV